MSYRIAAPSAETIDSALTTDRAFNRHSKNDGRHNSPYDRGRVNVGTDSIHVELIQGIDEESFRRVIGLGVIATTGYNPDDPPDDLPWEEMLRGGLQTGLEAAVVVFGITGLSRVATHQIVRTRKAAFHQQSQRATFMGDEPDVRMPLSVYRSDRARAAFMRAIDAAAEAYATACEEDISYQDARFILPEGSQTYIECEWPLRTFLDTYAYRACTMFQWEHVYVMREAGRLLIEAHPWLAPYVKISCEKSQRCTFMGWENVEEQCDFPWAKEELRVYRPDPALRIG